MYQHPSNRPVFINLFKIHFPLNAWLSVGHRVSGLTLFIALSSYLILLNLLIFTSTLSLHQLQSHWLALSLHSGFWMALSFHWLTGLRHLLAEHFTDPTPYQIINSTAASQLLLAGWGLISALIIQLVWF